MLIGHKLINKNSDEQDPDKRKTAMSEVDIIIHILLNLPEEYEVAVSELERKLKDDSVQLSMEDIRETLGSRFQRIVKNHEAKKQELAFAAFKK